MGCGNVDGNFSSMYSVHNKIKNIPIVAVKYADVSIVQINLKC